MYKRQVLGKPRDREDALQMLRTMSGRTHEVFTGVCITTTDWQRSFTAQTEVRFATLSEEEIAYYVDNFQPMDKAGAYGAVSYTHLDKLIHFSNIGLPWVMNKDNFLLYTAVIFLIFKRDKSVGLVLIGLWLILNFGLITALLGTMSARCV